MNLWNYMKLLVILTNSVKKVLFEYTYSLTDIFISASTINLEFASVLI